MTAGLRSSTGVAAAPYTGSAYTWESDVTISGDFTVTGNFSFGDASTDDLSVTGSFTQTYGGTEDGHTVTGDGNLTAGKDLVRFSSTGNISSTSNVVAIEQTTGAGTAGAYGLYVNCTGTNVEAIKVDAGKVVFDETLDVDGVTTLSAGMVLDNSATDAVSLTGTFDHGIDFTSMTLGTATDGALIKAGTSGGKVVKDLANLKFLSFYLDNGATSGDNRGMYLRLYHTGAGGGGEAARIFTTCEDVACGTAHGAHISLNFGSTGSVTGLGVAMRGTLHVPNDASWAPGTISSLQAEIFSDGDDSDTDGATEVSFIRVVNAGNANGIADVDDDANLMTIEGGAIAAGNMVQAETDETKFSHKIRCKVHGSTMYLMACDS